MKLFIKRPAEGKDLLPKVLKWATEETDHPDVRDRGYIYWRLLSTNPVAAKQIVLSDKPDISVDTDNLDPNMMDEVRGWMGRQRTGGRIVVFTPCGSSYSTSAPCPPSSKSHLVCSSRTISHAFETLLEPCRLVSPRKYPQ